MINDHHLPAYGRLLQITFWVSQGFLMWVLGGGGISVFQRSWRFIFSLLKGTVHHKMAIFSPTCCFHSTKIGKNWTRGAWKWCSTYSMPSEATQYRFEWGNVEQDLEYRVAWTIFMSLSSINTIRLMYGKDQLLYSCLLLCSTEERI